MSEELFRMIPREDFQLEQNMGIYRLKLHKAIHLRWFLNYFYKKILYQDNCMLAKKFDCTCEYICCSCNIMSIIRSVPDVHVEVLMFLMYDIEYSYQYIEYNIYIFSCLTDP